MRTSDKDVVFQKTSNIPTMIRSLLPHISLSFVGLFMGLKNMIFFLMLNLYVLKNCCTVFEGTEMPARILINFNIFYIIVSCIFII